MGVHAMISVVKTPSGLQFGDGIETVVQMEWRTDRVDARGYSYLPRS
jgi:hypothetical protein